MANSSFTPMTITIEGQVTLGYNFYVKILGNIFLAVIFVLVDIRLSCFRLAGMNTKGGCVVNC